MGPPPTEDQVVRLVQVGRVVSSPRTWATPQADRLEPYREQITTWLQDEQLQITRVHELLGQRGLHVTYSTVERFPTAAHLASWAGICPGNNESAGKRKSGRIRRGSPWLRTSLVEAAHAAVRAKDTYLSAQVRRLAARRGAKKAFVGVAQSILVIVWHSFQHDCPYADLGTIYFDEHDRQPPTGSSED